MIIQDLAPGLGHVSIQVAVFAGKRGDCRAGMREVEVEVEIVGYRQGKAAGS